MLILLAALLAVAVAVLLARAARRGQLPGDRGTWLAVLAAMLVIGLAALAATGRLNWIAALVAAIIPFARRILGLLQYAPLLRRLFGEYRPRNGTAGGAGRRAPQAGSMTRDQALEILGLGPGATREEIVAAHRRLMQKLHPDRGGSSFLAQQLNEARKILLGDHPDA